MGETEKPKQSRGFIGLSGDSRRPTAEFRLNAFQNATNFAALVYSIQTNEQSRVVLMAHSLGNILTSAAICDGGLSVDSFFALNGAVAAEAYLTSPPEGWCSPSNSLVHTEWRNYDPKTWASHWHELFPVGDDRNKLTWLGRFATAAPILHNYYSSDDEVLEILPDSANVNLITGVELDWEWDWIPVHPNFRRYVWQKQALFKGRNPFYGTQWAGWGFHKVPGNNDDLVVAYPPSVANVMTTNQLQNSPIFCHYPADMFDATIPLDLRNEILARGIPELTPPIGISAVETAGFATNVNMRVFQDPINGWPQRNIDFSDGGTRPNRWLHTDLMNLSHFHTHLLFESLVTEGGLK